MQNKKLILLLAVFAVIMAAQYVAKPYLFPPPPKPEPEPPPVATAAGEETQAALRKGVEVGSKLVKLAKVDAERSALTLATGPFLKLAKPSDFKRPVRVEGPAKKPSRRIVLGSKDPNSKYHLQVVLDSRGGGVRLVLLNKFQAVDEVGQPMWDDPETKKIRKLEVLIPDDPYDALSNLVYHFDLENARHDEGGAAPLETLGIGQWKVEESPAEGSSADDSDTPQRVVFSYRLEGKGEYKGKFIVITKTYTLNPGEYHLGLEVKMYKETPDDKELWFRYQMAGGHGLPIEGRWYTNTFRNALIGQQDKGSKAVYREIQDGRSLTGKEGGDEILRDPDRFIRYAAVAIQYFASAIVVSEDQPKQDFLSRVRPTVETTAVKGVVRSTSADGFVLDVGGKYDQTFRVEDPEVRVMVPPAGVALGVVYKTYNRPDGKEQDVALKLFVGSEAAKTQPLFENDVTVRVATEPIDLKDSSVEKPVVHKYLLYNGPVKPMLLGHMSAPGDVPDEVVTRYTDKLGLNTMIDYHSPGKMGEFANMIGWTWLVIHTTNLMHLILWAVSLTGLPYALCIFCLTIMVRGMMHPISRKAALTNIKMQELQPEIKKLKEKFKDDPQGLNREVWALQRRSGANPLSTCWLMFLQMPVFMGLYFALQESIHFRAASFWPTWINNLAAPDMLIWWTDSIPFLSAPESYGQFFYLGPYFNILPVVAVTLMIFQQKYTMPPPTDEQQEMQQKMMKYMMVFMGLMFYKVPSGLVLYFIAGSIWSFCERKLLPKKKKPGAESADTVSAPSNATSTAITAGNGSAKSDNKGRNRVKGAKKRKAERAAAAEASGESESVLQRVLSWWRGRRERVNDWWEKIQEEAQKKNR